MVIMNKDLKKKINKYRIVLRAFNDRTCPEFGHTFAIKTCIVWSLALSHQILCQFRAFQKF